MQEHHLSSPDFALLLRQNAFEYAMQYLLNAPPFIRFSALVSEKRNYSGPVWSPVTVPYNPFVVLFPASGNFLTCVTIYYLAEDLMGPSTGLQSHLPHTFSSPIICSDDSGSLVLSGLPALRPSLRESLHLSMESREVASWSTVRLIAFSSYVSGITVLSCLMSSVLKMIFSYILSGFNYSRWEGKSSHCYYILDESIPVYVFKEYFAVWRVNQKPNGFSEHQVCLFV